MNTLIALVATMFILVTGLISNANASVPHGNAKLTLINNISTNYKVKANVAHRIVTVVEKVATKHKLDKFMILAIMSVESTFKVNAKNHHCVGLMQVNLKSKLVKQNLMGRNPYDVTTNLDLGIQVMNYCKVMKDPLGCYHGGKSVVYTKMVLAAYHQLKNVKSDHRRSKNV
jgi:soluble lytic murein transglycosylase-like protein